MENIETTITEETTNTPVQEEVVFTESQKEAIAKLIQAESDRRTNQALAKQRKEYEKKISLASLDGAEREKQENLNTIAELREQLAAFQIEKNRSELKSVLSSRGLSAEFADIVTINDNIEESQANIDKLDKLFKKAVEAEVNKRLAGSAPRGGSSTPAEITKESAKKMSISDLQKLADRDPEAFNKLFN